jgi:hypothetical protein
LRLSPKNWRQSELTVRTALRLVAESLASNWVFIRLIIASNEKSGSKKGHWQGVVTLIEHYDLIELRFIKFRLVSRIYRSKTSPRENHCPSLSSTTSATPLGGLWVRPCVVPCLAALAGGPSLGILAPGPISRGTGHANKSSFTALMLSQAISNKTLPENCILNTKPQRGCHSFKTNRLRAASSLISLRLICRACKSTSQRKLESWHAGSSLHVPLIHIFRVFDQFAIDLPCLQKHLSAQT